MISEQSEWKNPLCLLSGSCCEILQSVVLFSVGSYSSLMVEFWVPGFSTAVINRAKSEIYKTCLSEKWLTSYNWLKAVIISVFLVWMFFILAVNHMASFTGKGSFIMMNSLRIISNKIRFLFLCSNWQIYCLSSLSQLMSAWFVYYPHSNTRQQKKATSWCIYWSIYQLKSVESKGLKGE